MLLRRLRLEGFRSLRDDELSVPAGLTLVVGANGAGKTSVLEAVALLGNLVSFRSPPANPWIRRGLTTAALEGELEETGHTFRLRQELHRVGRLRRLLQRGSRRLGAAEYLTIFPVVALSSADRQLVFGGPEERRHFLDRVAFHLNPELLAVLQRYRRALAQRNALLLQGGSAAALDAFEGDLARYGARLALLRQRALLAVEEFLPAVLDALGWRAARPFLRYHWPDGGAAEDEAAVARQLRSSLLRSRGVDRRRGVTNVGPHRHELLITVQGVHAREALSAGQGKLLAVALRLAAMAVLERRRGSRPCVVFDDIDAELDSEALGCVLRLLAGGGQVLASSAHPQFLARHGGVVWQVQEGVVTEAGGSWQ